VVVFGLMDEITSHINNGYLKILARPNSPKTELVGWDDEKKVFRVNVHAKPDNNEANIEIVKYFSKLLKKKVIIKSGTRSKEKLLFIE
jgi:uncharacterized protein (TIGR00251 family)